MQRYSPDELDQIADEHRDRAIDLARIRGVSYDEAIMSRALEIRACVALAEFLRRDAARMRQLRAQAVNLDSR